MNHNNGKTFVLVKCALLAALAVALNFVKFAPWPNGGSITAAAMAPIVLAGLMFGPGWGALTGFTFSLLQMLLDGISAPPVETVLWYILVILLDYVIAYTVLGLAGIIAKPFLKPVKGAVVGTLAVTAVRYLCHIASGILIWGVYAPEGTPVWLYSLYGSGNDYHHHCGRPAGWCCLQENPCCLIVKISVFSQQQSAFCTERCVRIFVVVPFGTVKAIGLYSK